MKLITRNTDYALQATCFMAKSKEKVISVSDLVRALRVPRSFLRKLLQVLNRKGILKSTKGLGGGFKLAKPSNKIFLLDLMEIFQGPFKLNECFLKKMACPNMRTCVLRKKITALERRLMKELENITIASLLR